MSTGFVLNIPQEMLNRLEDADKKIEKLAKTSEDAQIRIVSAFKSMTTNGVDAFIQRLDVAQQKLAQLGGTQLNVGINGGTGGLQQLVDAINKLSQASKTNITINGLGAVGNQTHTAIDAINKLMATLQQLQQMGGQQFLGGVNNLGRQTLREMNREAKKMQKTMQDLDDAIQKYGISAADLANKLQQARQAQQQFNAAAKQQAQSDVSGLIGMKGQQTTLNELKNYANELKRTMANLDPKSQEWKNLNDIYKQTNREIKNIQNSMKDVQKQSRNLLDISGQLSRRLALVFSVSQITGYVKKLIEVRGEFELQQRSLQAILQNKDQANRIWQQTVDLAVRSPFRVKELVSYTKQLAAYRIESDKLFETNKMLADISAGLGVDMQRLILAFGQVRSAAYLRGTELRQFTEAGIPILEQLSQHFSELEGRAVSVGDVFDRISKRMVTFADVEGILKKITSEGGTFYRMQEIQAETLQGQISNLKDSVDIMLNDIGKAHEGTLKNSVAFVRSLIVNWEVFADIIKTAAASFALYKLNLLAVTKAQIANNIALQSLVKNEIIQRGVIKGLIYAFKSLAPQIDRANASMANFGKANLWIIALSAVISSIIAIVRHTKQMNEALAEQDKAFNNSIVSLKKLEKQYKEASKGDDSFATKMKSLRELSTRLEDRNLKLSVSIEDVNAENIDKIFEENTKILEVAYQYGKEIGQALTRGINAAQGTVLGFSFFGENLKEDAEDYGASMAKLMSWSMQEQMSSIENSAMLNYQKMGKYAKQYFDSIKDGQRANESDYEWTKRRATALVMISKLEGDIVGKNKELQRALRSLVTDSIELGHETKSLFDRLAEGAGGLENLRKAAKENPIEMSAQIKTEVDKLDFDPASKQFIINDLYAMLNLRVNYVESNGKDPKKELDGWAKRVKEAVDAVNKEIKRNSKDIKDTDLFPVPQVGQTKAAYLNNAKAVIGIAKMTYDELQQIEDQELIDRTNALSPFVATFEKILNLYKAPKETGGNKDTFTPMLRTVKEIYQEFKKLQGSFDDLTAKEGALAKFGDAFKEAFGKTPEQMGFDLFSEEGVKAAYDYLISKAPDAKKKIQAQLAKGEIVWDVKLQTKKDADQQLLDDIQELFDQYDLSLDLKKLNIPPDRAKSLFDVDYLDLDGLKKAVQDQEAKFIGTDMEDEYKKFLDKIDDMENKAAKERMKTYVKYLMEGMSERVKLKIEEMRQLKEIEESDEFTPEQKERIKAGVSKEARAEQQKQDWKSFQGSDMYTMMFEDLEHYGTAAIDMLYTKLSELKTSLSDLPASEVKEIVGQIEKLENIQIERNPFESLKKYKDEVKNIGFTEDELQTQLLDSQKAEEDAQKYIDIYNTVMQSLMSEDEGVFEEIDAETLSQWNQMLRLAEEQGKTVEEILADRKATVKTEQDNQGKIVKNLNSYKKLDKSQEAALKKTEVWLNAVGDVFSASKELMESLGVESDSVAMTIADTGSSMVSLTLSAVQFTLQLQAMGVAANSALGVIGWIAIAIQAVATILSAIFSAKDKALQKEIDGHLARAEKLHEKYEELSDAIDSAYDSSVVRQLNKEIEKTIKLEIKAIEAAIAAEKAQKASKIDWDWVDEQEKAVKDLYDTLNEEHDKYIARWGGFGSEEARFDFIESMTQAWLDSFKETGDGLAGLEEKWDEYFDNLAMKQMALRVSKAAIDKYLDMWDKYVSAESAGGEDLTEAEAQDLRLKKEDLLNDLSEKYTALAESLGITPTTEGGGLSALTKGIQGVSESTAQVLEALLNSMRFYVADSNAKLTQLLNNMMGGETESPMLAELRAQTKWMRDIYNLINGMTATHPSGGRGIKTVM